MNRTFFLTGLVFLLNTVDVVAQKPGPKHVAASHVTNSSVIGQAFIGTWEWRSGSDAFRIVLSCDPAYVLPDGQMRNMILSRHSYIRNGVLVEESITRNPTSPKERTLVGTPRKDWELELFFSDITKHKSGRAVLTMNSSSPNQFYFELHEMEGVYIGRVAPALGFTVPTTVTLTRVP
jgi:hypothetical protein